MARPPPPEHTRWKKGQSGNPAGMPKGLLRSGDIQSLMARFWHLSREELHTIVANPKSSMGEIMVASVIAKAAKDGDYARLSFLLDRMIGRVPNLEVSANISMSEIEQMSTPELLEIVKDKYPEIKKLG